MIAAGFGFRTGATQESLLSAYALAAQATGQAATCCATAATKAQDPAIAGAAGELGLPLVAIDSTLLAQQRTKTQSAASQAAHNTGSVAEAAALAAAGPGARLLAARVISSDTRATCAFAIGTFT